MQKTSIAIVGLGYWGPNWLRNFSSIDTCTVRYGCDRAEKQCKKFSALYPSIRFTQSFDEVIADRELDAIVIATPTSTHFPLAKAALLAGKHVLIEKPMTEKSAQAKELVALARKKKRIILVDHTFAFTQAVKKINEIVGGGKLGTLLYFDSTRINLGLIQKDTSVFYDLAVHDLTILNTLVDLGNITEVYATGASYYGQTFEIGHIHLTFASGFHAHIGSSWLSPVKIRSTLIGGKKAMIVYNDTEPSEKIRLYDKGVVHDDTKPDPFFPSYRSGDVLIPALSLTEALETEARHFLDCIKGESAPIVSGKDGQRMVELLALIEQSAKTKKAIRVTGI